MFIKSSTTEALDAFYESISFITKHKKDKHKTFWGTSALTV